MGLGPRPGPAPPESAPRPLCAAPASFETNPSKLGYGIDWKSPLSRAPAGPSGDPADSLVKPMALAALPENGRPSKLKGKKAPRDVPSGPFSLSVWRAGHSRGAPPEPWVSRESPRDPPTVRREPWKEGFSSRFRTRA